MKKILFTLALVSAIGLAACSGNQPKPVDEKEAGSAATQPASRPAGGGYGSQPAGGGRPGPGGQRGQGQRGQNQRQPPAQGRPEAR